MFTVIVAIQCHIFVSSYRIFKPQYNQNQCLKCYKYGLVENVNPHTEDFCDKTHVFNKDLVTYNNSFIVNTIYIYINSRISQQNQ